MTQSNFSVKARDIKVKGKKIRRDGLIPANIYGAGKPSTAIQIPPKDFKKLYQEVGETGLVYLQVGDKKTKIPVLIDDVQENAFGSEILHVAFKQVDLKDKITTEIPVVLVGEFEMKEAVLVTVRDTIEVEALPTDFPEHFEINIGELTEIGQTITLADLKFDRSKVELVIGEEGEEAPVVLVQELREEVEEEPEPVDGEEEVGDGVEKTSEGDDEKSGEKTGGKDVESN